MQHRLAPVGRDPRIPGPRGLGVEGLKPRLWRSGGQTRASSFGTLVGPCRPPPPGGVLQASGRRSVALLGP